MSSVAHTSVVALKQSPEQRETICIQDCKCAAIIGFCLHAMCKTQEYGRHIFFTPRKININLISYVFQHRVSEFILIVMSTPLSE